MSLKPITCHYRQITRLVILAEIKPECQKAAVDRLVIPDNAIGISVRL